MLSGVLCKNPSYTYFFLMLHLVFPPAFSASSSGIILQLSQPYFSRITSLRSCFLVFAIDQSQLTSAFLTFENIVFHTEQVLHATQT